MAPSARKDRHACRPAPRPRRPDPARRRRGVRADARCQPSSRSSRSPGRQLAFVGKVVGRAREGVDGGDVRAHRRAAAASTRPESSRSARVVTRGYHLDLDSTRPAPRGSPRAPSRTADRTAGSDTRRRSARPRRHQARPRAARRGGTPCAPGAAAHPPADPPGRMNRRSGGSSCFEAIDRSASRRCDRLRGDRRLRDAPGDPGRRVGQPRAEGEQLLLNRHRAPARDRHRRARRATAPRQAFSSSTSP